MRPFFADLRIDKRQTICASALVTAFLVAAIMELIRFKHSRFSTRLPADYMYSPSHYWMAKDSQQEDLWRVGFTKFATRMLGELVEAESK